MEFSVEKKISNFISDQFPQFYLEEGENFVLFVKAYYEWMESGYAVSKANNSVISTNDYTALSADDQAKYDLQLNPIYQARRIFDLRDLDNTLESFLEHFQQKYLYGIPFNVIINKRFLLKHILDVYRSKGNIQCFKLLFKLIYNQNVEVYLPGIDILKPSDGSWVENRYIEVTGNTTLQSIVGKSIVGVSSNTHAIVESYITEAINQNIISSLFISHINPRGGEFLTGEKIVTLSDQANSQAILNAPTVYGSVDKLHILNGGQDFKVGDIIKLTHRDIITNELVSKGVNSKLKVTGTTSVTGTIDFNIERGGFGYLANAQVYMYRGEGDTTGQDAFFQVDQLSYNKVISYNTDIIIDFRDITLDATAFGFPANPSGNVTSTMRSVETHLSNTFGTIATLTNIFTGSDYTQNMNIFVRSNQLTRFTLPGTPSYNTGSNTVTGVSTVYQGNTGTVFFANGDIIFLQANTTDPNTGEYQIIKEVVSNTEITLYGPPKHNSTDSAKYKAMPVTLPSNYAVNEPLMLRSDGTVNGKNEYISAIPIVANNAISSAVAIDSGKGYDEGEKVYAYLYNGLAPITIINGGSGYANGEQLIFQGGNTSTPAKGYITTDEDGVIVSAVLSYKGSNYVDLPVIKVRTIAGSGAVLISEVLEFNTYCKISGNIMKTGVGRKEGYWPTTKGFLNSNKYIQDSHFYQDYSYQIKAGLTLDKYKDILYNTFHIAGAEMFGEFYLPVEEQSNKQILHNSTQALYISDDLLPTFDSTLIKSDNRRIRMDRAP
jgi:hypothetical protein